MLDWNIKMVLFDKKANNFVAGNKNFCIFANSWSQKRIEKQRTIKT